MLIDKAGNANFSPDLEVPSCFESNMAAMCDRKFPGRMNTFPECICFLWKLREASSKESSCVEISAVFLILLIYIPEPIALGMKY